MSGPIRRPNYWRKCLQVVVRTVYFFLLYECMFVCLYQCITIPYSVSCTNDVYNNFIIYFKKMINTVFFYSIPVQSNKYSRSLYDIFSLFLLQFFTKCNCCSSILQKEEKFFGEKQTKSKTKNSYLWDWVCSRYLNKIFLVSIKMVKFDEKNKIESIFLWLVGRGILLSNRAEPSFQYLTYYT